MHMSGRFIMQDLENEIEAHNHHITVDDKIFLYMFGK